MKTVRGIGKQYRERLAKVLQKHSGTIDSSVVSKTLGVSAKEANRLLFRWSKSGWVDRIKRGVYIARPIDSLADSVPLENPMIIAEKLFSPGYVGGFTAIKHWDLSEQLFETIYYFTTNKIKQKDQTIGGTTFHLTNISSYRLFGTKTIWLQTTKVRISDPTKTVIDLLDRPELVGGMTIVFDVFQEYMASDYYDFNLLIEYGDQNRNMTVFKRLGFMLEAKGLITEHERTVLSKRISSGLSLFDPTLECKYVNKRWNLKIPSPWKKEYDRQK